VAHGSRAISSSDVVSTARRLNSWRPPARIFSRVLPRTARRDSNRPQGWLKQQCEKSIGAGLTSRLRMDPQAVGPDILGGPALISGRTRRPAPTAS